MAIQLKSDRVLQGSFDLKALNLLFVFQVKIDVSNEVKINDATVLTPDVEADNGVIHVIDTVLISL